MITHKRFTLEDYFYLLFKRLFRIWPAYGIVLWLYFSVFPVVGSGALWEYI